MIPQSGTLEISASRLMKNVELFRSRIGSAMICATVKADAYGHGVRQIAPMLQQAGITWACVYSIEEAAELTSIAPWLNVLVLAPLVGPPDSFLIDLLRPDKMRLTVTDLPSLQALSAAVASRATARVHIQIDTGLTRAGVAIADAANLIQRATELPGIQLEGIYSHLSHGDVAGHQSIRRQAEALHAVAGPVKHARPTILIHLQNSGGAWHLESGLDMVRIGIGLYGLQPALSDPIEGLFPIARLTAPILTIHNVAAGVGAGYGHTFIARRPSRLAIVPVGYADGYPRALSNAGMVQVRGANAPLAGRVSMDQIIVDVTDVQGPEVGDEAVVMSHDPAAANCADRIAAAVGTIGYEIVTGLGRRLKRVTR